MAVLINSLKEILEDICVEAEDLGDVHTIIRHYNKQLSSEELNQATLEVLQLALQKQLIVVALDTDAVTGKYKELQWTLKEIIAYVEKEWEKIGMNNTDRFYCLWIIPKISAEFFKKIIAKTAMDSWKIISEDVEKLVYSDESINPGLTFVYKKEGEGGKPTIETWKSGEFITKRIFDK